MIKTSRTTTASETVHIDFGAVDSRGRSIGAKITTFGEEFAVIPADAPAYDFWLIEPGPWFTWYPQATRNGVKYGALQPARRFRTAEERDADIERYIAAARKRVAKA